MVKVLVLYAEGPKFISEGKGLLSSLTLVHLVCATRHVC